jgi:cyclohexanecarboxylate-CoA ligase/acyl-CoA synthetase
MPVTVSYPPERMQEYRAVGWWRGDTLPGWVAHWAATAPDKPAIVSRDAVLSYAALWRAAGAVAQGLRRLGISHGDVVAVQLPNCPEFLIAYLATGLCGAVLQTVHMNYRASELETLLGHSGAKAVIAPTAAKDYPAADVTRAVRERLTRLEHIVLVGAAADGTHRFGALLASGDGNGEGAGASAAAHAARPEDPFLLLYTSGTTAAPKGVAAIHEGFLANARMSAAEHGITSHAILLSAAPFTHLYGLFSTHMAFATGATVALLPAFAPGDLVAALKTFQPTGIFTAPAHIAACFQQKLLAPELLGSLEFAQISGSICAPELASALQGLMPHGKVTQLWGMTELQAGAFHRPTDELAARLTSVGRASPGTRLRVAGSQNEPLAPGSEGELQVRGPSVFSGYHDNAAATAAAFTPDGWFSTGDLAAIDEAGFVRITGRTKELINRGGVKFNPVDVENLIATHPAVSQCAIIPMADPVLGERACCFVVPRPGTGQGLTLDVLRTWLSGHAVSKVKWPERLELVDSMPMTPTRKVIKGKLIERLADVGRLEQNQSKA